MVALWLALGALYGVTTPLFEAPDELWHYPYVKHLADGRGLPLPVADPALNPAQQEATQPPLYYALGALLTAGIDTGRFDELALLNPHAAVGRPSATDNRNVVVHSPAEDFPYRGVALAVHLVRLLSVALGALTVAATYLLARELAPERPRLALAAALTNALLPQYLFIGGSVNNDNLIVPLASLALLLLVRLLRRAGDGRAPGLAELLLLGVVLGLAALTKLSGLALLPLAGGVLAWLARRSPARLLAWGGAVGGPVLLIAGWWYARNWWSFGDPLLLGAHLAIAGGRPTPLSLPAILLEEGQGLRWSFWGVFGWFNVVAETAVYRLYDVLTLLALAGLGLGLARWRRVGGSRAGRPRPAGAPVALLGLWCLLLLVLLLRWSQVTMASQGRLLFPAISAICLALAAGWQALAPDAPPPAGRWPRARHRLREALAWAPVTVLGLLALVTPFRYIAPAYAAPPKLPPGTLAAAFAGQSIDVSFRSGDGEGRMLLVAVRLGEPSVVAGRPLQLDLYWRALAVMDRSYSVYVQLYDGAGQVVARRDTYPGGGAYATSRLAPGDELHDRYLLQVSPTARPGAGHLDVGLYEYPSLARLQPYDGAGRALRSPNVASFPVYAPEPAPAPPGVALAAGLGEAIALTGYRLDASDLRPGGVLAGGLYFAAAATPERDYTVFVHVARVGEPPAAQADAPPQAGGYPTSLWRRGDQVHHPFAVALGRGVPPGEYALLVGLYDPATGRRLEVRGSPSERLLGWLRRLAGRASAAETAVRLATLRVRS